MHISVKFSTLYFYANMIIIKAKECVQMFKVDINKCIACMQCIKDCPASVISLKDGKADINNEGCIKCGHCVAVCPVEAVSTDDYNMNEVVPYNKETFSVNPENLLNFIKFRRSVRRFKNKEVEKEKIIKIIEAGRYTQTSRNSQDVSYIVVTEKLSELRELAYESLKKKGEYILANLTPETEHLKRYANMWLYSYNEFKKAQDFTPTPLNLSGFIFPDFYQIQNSNKLFVLFQFILNSFNNIIQIVKSICNYILLYKLYFIMFLQFKEKYN